MEHTLLEFSKYIKEIGIYSHDKDFYNKLKPLKTLNEDNYDDKIIQILQQTLLNRRTQYLNSTLNSNSNANNSLYSSNGNISNNNNNYNQYNHLSENNLHSTNNITYTDIIDAQSMYNGFINLDDRYIITLFRKLLSIKNKELIEIKQQAFLRWKLIISQHKLKILNWANDTRLAKLYENSRLNNKGKVKSRYGIEDDLSKDNVNDLCYYSDQENNYLQEKSIVEQFNKERLKNENAHGDRNSKDGNDKNNEADEENISDNENDYSNYNELRNKEGVPIYEKLHKDREIREKRKNDIKKERNLEDLKECTFAPKINKNINIKNIKNNQKTNRNDNEPIYDKLNKVSIAILFIFFLRKLN